MDTPTNIIEPKKQSPLVKYFFQTINLLELEPLIQTYSSVYFP
jgi:hypothetical protein